MTELMNAAERSAWANGYDEAKNNFLQKTAEQQLEIVLGSDRIVRINVDGACVMRVRMLEGCQFTERNMATSYAEG